jgi:hypothetical protein
MASTINKLFNARYSGLVVAGFKSTLGLEIKGGEKFNTPGKPKQPRVVCVPIAEGLLAALRNCVSSVSVVGQAIWCRISADAYQDVHCISASMPRPLGAVVGIDPQVPRFMTTLASTSQNAKADEGKTELSVYPLALLAAAVAYQAGGSGGRRLLEVHLDLLRELNTIGELPLAGSSQAADNLRQGNNSSLSDRLKALVRSVTDEAYEYLTYGQTTTGLQALPTQRNCWQTVKTNVVAPPGWRPGQPDMADLILKPDLLADFLNDRSWPRPQPQQQQQPQPSSQQKPRKAKAAARATATTQPASSVNSPTTEPQPDAFPWCRYIRLAARICPPAGGSYSLLLQGPAGTRKTTSVFSAGDRMPTVRFSVTAESQVELLLGDYGRNASGQWTPRLGELARVVRASMLAAFKVALKRGGHIAGTVSRFKGASLLPVIEKIAADPTDQDSLAELDRLAWPFDPDVWATFESAYFESGAPEVGPVIRVFFDEAHDASQNPSLETVLKVLFEDQRKLMLSIAGAGWRDLYGPNCHFVAAGNPDEAARRGSEFGRALRSRFGFTFGVGYPMEEDEAKLVEGATQSANALFNYPPIDLALASFAYEPQVRVARPIPREMAEAVAKLGTWTRDQRRRGMLGECLDVRGTIQIARTASHLLATRDTPSQAFMEAVEPVLARLAKLDEDGLPVDAEVESIRQHTEYLTRHYRL